MVWSCMGVGGALLEAAARGDAARLAAILNADARDINVTDEVRLLPLKVKPYSIPTTVDHWFFFPECPTTWFTYFCSS